jgi:hypothetical protein
MPNTVINTRILFSGNYDPIVTTWVSTVKSNGFQVPSASYLSKLNTFVVSNKSNLLLRDRFWIFAQETGCQAAGRVSLINPTSTLLSEVNSPTWTALQGYTGNGTSMYLNTKYNPSTHGVKFTQNDGMIDVYTRLTIAAGTKAILGAFVSATAQIWLSLNWTAIGKLYSVNTVGQATQANTTTQGLFSILRTTSNLQTLYKNGSSLGTNANPTVSPVNNEIYILGANNNGVAGSFDTNQVSRASVGGAVGMNISQDYGTWQAFMISLGTQV